MRLLPLATILLAFLAAGCTGGVGDGESVSPVSPSATPAATESLMETETPIASATPIPSATPTLALTPSPTPQPTAEPTPVSTPTPTPEEYVVQPGDTLTEVGDRFDVTVQELRAWNHDDYPTLATDPDLIQVGWVLELTGPPGATLPPQPTPEPTLQPTPPPSTPEPTPPPADDLYVDDYCTIRDVLTPYRSYDQHHLTVLDWTYMVGPTYAPPDLVPAGSAGFGGPSGEKLIRQIAVADLAAVREAAAAAGHAIQIQSAYRSYQTQADTFEYWVAQVGYEEAINVSARPGHSQHQLGTTIDFTSGGIPPWQQGDWGATPAGSWMMENAWRFGWVLTYPPGAEEVACYTYEPWHYRWVGREMAADWRASGLVFHEYQVRLGEELR